MREATDRGWHRALHGTGKAVSALFDFVSRGSERIQARRLTEALCGALRTEWEPLLRAHGGRVREEPQPGGRTAFDYSSCLVLFPQCTMLVSRGRGEVYVRVRWEPRAHWTDLSAILETDTPPPQAELSAFAEAIGTNWMRIASGPS